MAQRILPLQTGTFTCTNHTYIKLLIPPFFGSDLSVRVVVDEQYNIGASFTFSYFPPSTTAHTIVGQDGSSQEQFSICSPNL